MQSRPIEASSLLALKLVAVLDIKKLGGGGGASVGKLVFEVNYIIL